jgi:multisubunit Na+/H+ antiporter MnhB subunit
MTCNLVLFDAALAVTLIVVAVGVLLARELFQGIVLFIVFGLLLTIGWCRLEAVDVALAEAAIGAGLTGALLLNTWAATRDPNGTRSSASANGSGTSVVDPFPVPTVVALRNVVGSGVALLLTVSFILAACGMMVAIVPLAMVADAPRIATDQALPQVEVMQPVTAVLLGFRAYDTLLEVAVLLAAVLAAYPRTAPADVRSESPAAPILEAFTRLMVPVTILVAVYVLWIGTKAPGGAFQAAAMICAAGVLLLVSGLRTLPWTKLRMRFLLVVGLAIFLSVGVFGMAGGGNFLQYHPGWAGISIVLIETALTVSLAMILISLFNSTSPSRLISMSGGKDHADSTTTTKVRKS